jgi:hypothetical protein
VPRELLGGYPRAVGQWHGAKNFVAIPDDFIFASIIFGNALVGKPKQGFPSLCPLNQGMKPIHCLLTPKSQILDA